jgi:hypothetical protein
VLFQASPTLTIHCDVPAKAALLPAAELQRHPHSFVDLMRFNEMEN